MPVKSWNCPSCRKEFIVDAESARDACPWCKTWVEEVDGKLRVAPAEPAPASEPPAEPEPAGIATGTPAWWPFDQTP